MTAMQAVYRFCSRHRRWVVTLVYAGVTASAYALAFLLRFDLAVPEPYVATLKGTVLFLVVLRLGAFRVMRLSMERWRHIDTGDLARLVAAALLGTVLFGVALLGLQPTPRVPRSVLLIEAMLLMLLVAAIWLGYRMMFEAFKRHSHMANVRPRRALIVGAGEVGGRLASEMLRDPMGYRAVGFVDDDPVKIGIRIHGLEVLGSTGDLPEIARREGIEEMVIAIPSAEPSELRRVVEACEDTGLPFKVLPATDDLLTGKAWSQNLREVRIDDLLGRDPVRLELPELKQELAEKTVLITGAAGSIGSELARQVTINGPARVILFDKNESELYFLDLDLRRDHPEVEIRAVVGDVLDRALLKEIFECERPSLVFHAAAYKHVPLMEQNVRSAVRNNVLGTAAVANTAASHGVAKFVLISTDKAVRPANVMGATKRAAELIVLDCAERFPDTWYTAVRFGNVLGSRGSVVPLFERQLAAGEPLTVTDPEVTRFFMTIPEAVQLVLQASLLKEARGRIAMLDMGEPVRIVDLARKLIRLKGLQEGVDARIQFGGLRPGEKLHEELSSPHERTIPTGVDKIRLIASSGGQRDFLGVRQVLSDTLRNASGEGGEDLVHSMRDALLDVGDDWPRTADPPSINPY